MADKTVHNRMETQLSGVPAQCRGQRPIPQGDPLATRAESAFQAGDVKQAIDLYERAVTQGMQGGAVLQTLGDLYLFVRDFEHAWLWFERAWALGTSTEILDRLTLALVGMGRLDQAYTCITDALVEEMVPGIQDTQMAEPFYMVWPLWDCHLDSDKQDSGKLIQAWLRVADWLFKANQEKLAQHAYERILEHRHMGLAHARLGHLHRFGGDYSRALAHLHAAVDLEPDNACYQGLLANMQLLMGNIDEGVSLLRRITSEDSCNAALHSSYLLSRHYLPEQNRQTLLAERRRWGRLHAPRSLMFRAPKRDWDPERRLRIGYLGADFRQHSVGYTFAGVLNGRNRQAVEVYGYGSVCQPDAVTEQFMALFDVYRDVYSLEDAVLARLIEADRIDILVAVAGHSFGNRLKVLAYKPAPIQVDYGAINTLGIEQVDYRITDRQLDPPTSQACFLERLVYLPTGYVCYCPPRRSPVPGPLPAQRNGFMTFGCFNGAQKANRCIVNLWGLVLHTLPQSRLLIKCPGGEQPALRNHFMQGLTQAGVAPERVTVQGLLPQDRHLELYHQVDIALDTYPFNGCVTTLEGLWMGVPVITLVGQTTVARVGLTLLTQLGLDVFAAHSPDQYIQKALALASQTDALSRIRASLRQRMQASTLCDCARHARELEAAYRSMWRVCCESQGGKQAVAHREVCV